MKGINNWIGCIIGLLVAQITVAQSNLEFVENKGQWDEHISFKGDFSFGSFALKPDGGYRMLLYNQDDLSKYSSHQTNFPSSNQITNAKQLASNDNTLHGHVYEVKFLNANPHPIALPDKALSSYNNYFLGNDSSKWVSHCKIFLGVTYKNVYPNIDVRYYTNNGSLKYDLIVRPGGNPNNIIMYVDGADGVKLKNNHLSIQTSVNEIKELPPYSYLVKEDGREEQGCSYDVKGNIVRFKFNTKIDNKNTLVIDPQLVFSTFSGSKTSNWGYTATYDNNGNFYLGGIVFGNGFPISNGAFQTANNGGPNPLPVDIGVMKFDPAGQNILYATYIGGTGSEQPHSLVVDGSGNLIVSGRTTSTDYPHTQNNLGSCSGAWHIILTKLNATGTKLVGSRIIGGSNQDGVNIQDKEVNVGGTTAATSTRRNYGDDSRSEVIVDAAGNIYLASCTQSNDFPTVNAFQTQNGGTNGSKRAQDAVFIKTNADLSSVLCSTYLGGSDDDAAFVLSLNPANNNIYIAGGTASTDFPGAKGNSLYQNNQGLIDGFVSILSNDGSKLIQTSYWGTSGIDLVYGIQFDKFNFPYIMGTTTATWPVVNAPYSVTGGRQFIAKLQTDLSGWVYSTVFGTANSLEPNISPTAFLIDRCEQAYVSGWGGLGNSGITPSYPSSGTRGLPITNDAIQPTTDGSDFYFFVLAKNAQSQLYGSYFGQNGGNYPDHVDGGTSRFDKNGIIYQGVCANCGGGAIFPTGPPGVWSPSNQASQSGAGGCNMAAIKIAFNLAGLEAALKSQIEGSTRDTSGCLPLTVDFRDSIGDGKQYIWNYGDGTKFDTTLTSKVTHVFNVIGRFKVNMIAIDSNSCNIRDTSFIFIRIGSDSVFLSLQSKKLLPCTQLNYQFTNTSFLVNSFKQFKDSSLVINFGDGSPLKYLLKNETVFTHAFPAEGTYYVKMTLLDTNFCNFSDYIIDTLRIASTLQASFTSPAAGCAPYNALFTNTSKGGKSFTWYFGDGTTSTIANPQHLYSNIGTYIIKLVAIDSATCNVIDSTQFTLNTFGKPTAAFVATPQPPLANTAITFTNNSIGGTLFKFFFGDTDSTITTSVAQLVSHLYNETNTFRVCLRVYNAANCADTLCQNVTTLINPLFDVPNAFTPNGDGKNDMIYVRGYGIAKMQWNIYNRWGTLIYSSGNKSDGWNGTYQGRLQPQDVYHYTLEVTLTDGTSFTKKGDITLLR